jgi:hypothetical protein
MNIRVFTSSDIDELKRIHSLYFTKEFDLPDFMNYVYAFVVEDEKGALTMGGIRTIAECSIVTDLARDPRDRIKALYQILDASVFITRQSGHDQMYAWSQNPKWTGRLKRNGFKHSYGESLILDL